MKIRLRVDYRGKATGEQLHLAGTEIELDDETAARLLVDGRAELVALPDPDDEPGESSIISPNSPRARGDVASTATDAAPTATEAALTAADSAATPAAPLNPPARGGSKKGGGGKGA